MAKRRFKSLSQAGCLEWIKAELEYEELLQTIWSVTNNFIGYSMIVAFIWFGVSHGYWNTIQMRVFCIAAVVYFLSKYLYYPFVKDIMWTELKEGGGQETFVSFLGCFEVLYGRFNGDGCYSFFSLFYIPLVPLGRYQLYANRRMIQLGDAKYYYHTFKFCWREILYVYLKNWSFAAMVFSAISGILSGGWLIPYFAG